MTRVLGDYEKCHICNHIVSKGKPHIKCQEKNIKVIDYKSIEDYKKKMK